MKEPAQHAVFPLDLRVEDESVNAFIDRVMRTALRGEYEDFRLLWSAHNEPIEQEPYERGWKAVQEIRLIALEQIRRKDTDETLYLAVAHVRLDPDELAPDTPAEREVVLMLVREFDEWRLADAPAPLREYVLNRAPGAPLAPSGDNPVGAITDSSDTARENRNTQANEGSGNTNPDGG